MTEHVEGARQLLPEGHNPLGCLFFGGKGGGGMFLKCLSFQNNKFVILIKKIRVLQGEEDSFGNTLHVSFQLTGLFLQS